ncbi:hypothetical protein [Arthrobacter zhaoguopingii]|uniref:hypothetical protein n=1 Tax=Arthrobacter zhaoguopingii TaxID=2681491 RepID=UPI001358DA08|nr:hypothetical protein [Arthrobacter zhaoguopingii]
MTTTEEEARAKAQDSVKRLNEEEDYLRRQEYLSDADLLALLAKTVRSEKQTLDRWHAEGEFFIRAQSGKIHLPACPSMRQRVDRDAAWAPYLQDLERVRDWHGGDNAPEFPHLLKRHQVEALSRYQSCPTCAPTLDHIVKRPGRKGWTTLPARSLKHHHFGRTFFTEAGDELGELVRITNIATADSLEFKADFNSGRSTSDQSLALTYRTKTPEVRADQETVPGRRIAGRRGQRGDGD